MISKGLACFCLLVMDASENCCQKSTPTGRSFYLGDNTMPVRCRLASHEIHYVLVGRWFILRHYPDPRSVWVFCITLQLASIAAQEHTAASSHKCAYHFSP